MMIPFTEEKTFSGKDVIIRDRADQSRVTPLSLNIMCFCLSCVCAKLLQSCLTLCSPMDYITVHGVAEPDTTERLTLPLSCKLLVCLLGSSFLTGDGTQASGLGSTQSLPLKH